MPEKAPPLTKEQRLAEKLRENLHRRKAQARAMTTASVPALPKTDPTR